MNVTCEEKKIEKGSPLDCLALHHGKEPEFFGYLEHFDALLVQEVDLVADNHSFLTFRNVELFVHLYCLH